MSSHADNPRIILHLAPDEESSDLYESQDIGVVREDSGIDLRFPIDVTIPPISETGGLATVVGLGVRGRVRKVSGAFLAYFITPRSSIAKTPLSLANSPGVIDRGYTGELKVGLRNHSATPYVIKRGTSLFQIVLPNLEPIVMVVESGDSELFAGTKRGAGGFGSTGAEGVKK